MNDIFKDSLDSVKKYFQDRIHDASELIHKVTDRSEEQRKLAILRRDYRTLTSLPPMTPDNINQIETVFQGEAKFLKIDSNSENKYLSTFGAGPCLIIAFRIFDKSHTNVTAIGITHIDAVVSDASLKKLFDRAKSLGAFVEADILSGTESLGLRVFDQAVNAGIELRFCGIDLSDTDARFGHQPDINNRPGPTQQTLAISRSGQLFQGFDLRKNEKAGLFDFSDDKLMFEKVTKKILSRYLTGTFGNQKFLPSNLDIKTIE